MIISISRWRFVSTKSKASSTVVLLELIIWLTRARSVERICRYGSTNVSSSGCEWICISLKVIGLLVSERLLLHRWLLERISHRCLLRLLQHYWLSLKLIYWLLRLEALWRLHLIRICSERWLAHLKGWRGSWLLKVVCCPPSLERIAKLRSLLWSWCKRRLIGYLLLLGMSKRNGLVSWLLSLWCKWRSWWWLLRV